MHTGSFEWSITFYAAIAIVTLWVTVAVMIAAHFFGRSFDLNNWMRKDDRVVASVALGAAAVGFAVFAMAMFPYEKPYHAYEDITGTVQQVDSRLLPSGDAMQEKFVILYEDSGQQYGCEDTRCASVVPGDTLTLACILRWDYNGTDGYDCKFKNLEKAP